MHTLRFPETFGIWGGMSDEEREMRPAARDLNRHREPVREEATDLT